MSRLVVTLLVAVAVLGASVLRDACLSNCAPPAAHASTHVGNDATADRSCHESSTSPLPGIGGLPHGCEHERPDPLAAAVASAAADTRSHSIGVAAVEAVASLSLPRALEAFIGPWPDAGPPPIRPHAAVPLRV
jgi:hypothetical protein